VRRTGERQQDREQLGEKSEGEGKRRESQPRGRGQVCLCCVNVARSLTGSGKPVVMQKFLACFASIKDGLSQCSKKSLMTAALCD